MTSFFLAKPGFTPLLVTLFMALQLTACGTEDLLSAISPEIGTGTETISSGTNRAARISGVDTGSVIEDVDPDGDNLLEVGGKLDITDSDANEEAFIVRTVNGNYGDLEIDATGNWNYAADNSQATIQNLTGNETLTDNLIVSSVDGTTHTIVITIIGVIDSGNKPNNPAIITGTSYGGVTEDNDPDNDGLLETGSKLNVIDNDPGEAAFIATTFNGKYGNLTISADGYWLYSASNNQASIQNLNAGDVLSDNLTVSSLDGATQAVVIIISGVNEPNNPAVITGMNTGNVTEDVDPDNDNLLETSGKLNITDNDAGEAAFIATTINGSYGSLSISANGNWAYSANNNQAAIQNLNTGATLNDKLTVSSLDGTTHVVTITINGVNDLIVTSNIGINWVAPATREDNTPIALSDISGYKIYYGTALGQYPNSVTINDRTAVDYTFMNFASGNHYFVITTVDTQGRESKYSSAFMITI